jgi:hypothetical protein
MEKVRENRRRSVEAREIEAAMADVAAEELESPSKYAVHMGAHTHAHIRRLAYTQIQTYAHTHTHTNTHTHTHKHKHKHKHKQASAVADTGASYGVAEESAAVLAVPPEDNGDDKAVGEKEDVQEGLRESVLVGEDKRLGLDEDKITNQGGKGMAVGGSEVVVEEEDKENYEDEDYENDETFEDDDLLAGL